MSVPIGVLLSDLPAVMALVETVQKDFATKPQTGAQWAAALGLAPGGLGYAALTFADTIKAGGITIDEVAGILGLAPGGLLAQAVSLADTVIAQLKPATPPPVGTSGGAPPSNLPPGFPGMPKS